MADFCPIRSVDHLELYVGNAKQAAAFYGSMFGFANTAYRGLETKYREAASYVMEQGDVRLVLTTALIRPSDCEARLRTWRRRGRHRLERSRRRGGVPRNHPPWRDAGH